MAERESADKDILVVDDDYDVRTGVAEILEDEGFAVATATHGADALARLRAGHHPRLILLDLRMPVMDGEAFCRARSDDPALRAIPVIILSADAEAAEKASRCGATGLLRKPVQLDRLLEVTERYARRSS
jgi:CheY-like chemotaxis protein